MVPFPWPAVRVALFGVFVASLSASAGAQPAIRALSFPAPNAAGWNNGVARVLFLCPSGQSCPEWRWVEAEGQSQEIVGTLAATDGDEVRASVVLNIDWTAPRVQVLAPADRLVTSDSTILVEASVSDNLSGVTSATCNGVPAVVQPPGVVRCSVPLAPGVNDVVVEAADVAGNSGSTGVRVTRTGTPSTLRIQPEVLSVVLGQARTLQVMSEYGPVRGVTWSVDNAWVAEVAEATNLLTPRAPGVTKLTATRGGLRATAIVHVFRDRLEVGATRWKSGNLTVVQAGPPTPVGRNEPPDPPMVEVGTRPDRPSLLTSTDSSTGLQLWSEAAPISSAEKAAVVIKQAIGGALVVVEGRDGTGSSLVRGGPSAAGTPWRYRSPGSIRHQMVQDIHGGVMFIELRADGFPETVVMDGRTGQVHSRNPFGPGVDIVLNARCIRGAHAFQLVPEKVGPPTVDSGVVAFASVATNDVQDYAVCGQVSGRLRRTIGVSTISSEARHLHRLGEFESPAGSPAPEIALFRPVSDGRGGFLVPWTLKMPGESAAKARLARIAADGVVDEIAVPVVGEIVRWKDMAAMTDGTTVIAFNVVTGDIKWTRVHAAGGVRLLPMRDEQTLHIVSRTGEVYDEFGRLVKPPR